MKVGRRHKWKYDAGDWSEQKVTPEKWDFSYSVVKRRAGRAPEGSGAPVGTAYRWYILADQVVTKLDANSYMTEMAGVKYKLAHKRAEKSSWSASERAQRKQLAKLLREMLAELEAESTETAASGDGDGARPPRAKRRATRTTRAKPRARATRSRAHARHARA